VRKFLVALGGVAAGASLFASVSSGHPLEAGAKKASYNVVLITNDTFDPYYITVAAGAKAEAKKQGINLSWVAGKNIDVASQTQVLNAAMAKHPDFIVMSIIDAKAMIAPLKKVKSSGIPVITIDTDVADPSVRLGTISSDNTQGGRVAADVLAGLVGSGKVGYQGYTPGIASVDDRHNGFTTQLKKHPKLTFIGSSYDNYDLKDVASKVSATIRRNPDLQGLFAPATNEVIGTANAIQAAGKVGKIKLVGFDASPDEVNMLKRGVITALVVQKAYLMGQLGVREAVAYLSKKTAPPKKVNLGFVVATKSNINTPLISKYIYRSK